MTVGCDNSRVSTVCLIKMGCHHAVMVYPTIRTSRSLVETFKSPVLQIKIPMGKEPDSTFC